MGFGRKFRRITILASLLALVCAYPTSSIFAQSELSTTVNLVNEQKIQGKKKYIVVLKNTASQDQFIKKKSTKGNKFKKITNKKIFTTELDANELKNVQQDPEVAYVELDSTVEIATVDNVDIQNKELKTIEGNEQTIPWGIQSIGANLVHEKNIKGEKVKIAVLDTGIASQLDLQVKNGVSFVEGNTSFTDDNGHGTHVAGTIAALDNSFGVIGVAPNAELYAVKVLDQEGQGSYSQVIQGVEWAIENEMNIISMSFGGLLPSRALHDEIKKANENGILVVAAAGNRGPGEETEIYPALYTEVISVGASSSTNEIAEFSSTGKEVDLVAPGVGVLSTLNNGGYGVLSGTSMAVPHVTGAAALLWSEDNNLTNEQIKTKLYETATPLGEQRLYGHGLLNIARALGYTDSEIPPPPRDQEGSSNEEDLSLLVSQFDVNKIDNELLILSDQLLSLQKKAYNMGATPLAKQISLKYNELLLKSKALHNVPAELNEKVPAESSSQSMDMEINKYYESKESDFKELLNTYKQNIATFESRFSDMKVQDSEDEGDISILAYDQIGNNQSITAGQSANVSLKLASPKSRIIVTVYPSSNPGNVVATTTLYNKPADITIPYTWNTNLNTPPGEYKIKFHYPENSTDGSDNYWNIYVRSAEPPINDTYEPNNNTSTAYLVSLGRMYTSYISSETDRDYYKFTATSDGVLDISLSGPSGQDYNFAVYDSNMYYIGGGNSRSNIEQARVSVRGGATYFILVEGYNGAHSSEAYNLSIGTIFELPPTAPSQIGASPKSNSIYVYWSSVQGASSYKVKKNGALVTTTSNTSFTLTGLTPGEAYNIEIAAANNAGTSPYSSITVSTINETFEPNDTLSSAYTITPGNTYKSYISSETDVDYYKFSSPGSGVMNLQLEIPSWVDYDVEITDANGTQIGKGNSGIDIDESVNFSVKSGTVYYVKIVGFRSSYSSNNYTLTLSNLITSTPTTPTGLSATASDMSITLSWNRVSSATSYKVLKDGVAVASLTGTSYTITGLKPNTSYSLSVAAVNPLGSSSYSTIVKSTTSIQISDIRLNSPIDVDLPKGEYAVYKFVPAVSGEYKIATGEFGGMGGPSDTVLLLSTDSEQKNVLSQNDDNGSSKFSLIRYDLTAGTTYYIKIKHYSGLGSVHARLSISKVSGQEIRTLNLNSPVDLDTSFNEPGLFVFTPTTSGNYSFKTGYYRDDINQDLSDTALYAYSDSSFLNLIDMNDDADPDNGNYFSELNLSLNGGTSYYFKIVGFMDEPVHARFTVQKKDLNFEVGNDFDSAYPISLGSITDTSIDYAGDVDIFRFQAPINGVYTFETMGETDTAAELYDQSQILIDYNDDSWRGASSSITNELYAGRNYYLKVYHYDADATGAYSLRILQQEDNIDGEVLTVNSPITRMINYEGDEDLYIFIPSWSGQYTFKTTGSVDTVGFLMDENEDPITENDDSNDQNFSITANLTANSVYYLRVKNYDESKKDEWYTLIAN